jgi:hypothetical protein
MMERWTVAARRWAEVLDLLVEVVPPGPAGVIVDSFDGHSRVVADRLAAALRPDSDDVFDPLGAGG